MINIINDIQALAGNFLIVPFSLNKARLGDKAVKVEIVANISDNYAPLPGGSVFIVTPGQDNVEQPIETIRPEQFDSVFLAKIDTTTFDVREIHIRIYNNTMSYLSPNVIVTTENALDVAVKPIPLDFRPKSLVIKDTVKCTSNNTICDFSRENFDLEVMICNNATSQHPTWEDVTDAYLEKAPLSFKNKQKDDGEVWAVSVRYKVQKTNPTSTVQISDIVLHIL